MQGDKVLFLGCWDSQVGGREAVLATGSARRNRPGKSALLWSSWHFLLVFILLDPCYGAAELQDVSHVNHSQTSPSPLISEVLVRCRLLAV